MRLNGELKLGYYPTSDFVLNCLRTHFICEADVGHSNAPITLDPCCGAGEFAKCFRYPFALFGIELDTGRYLKARSCTVRCLEGDAFKAKISDELASLLFLNPPYNSGRGDSRLEHQFLKHFTPKLQIGGGLVYIIQKQYLASGPIAKSLVTHYENISVYAYPETEFDQVIVLATRCKPVSASQQDIAYIQATARAASGDLIPLGRQYENALKIRIPARQDRFCEPAGREDALPYDFSLNSIDFSLVEKEILNSRSLVALNASLFTDELKITENPPMPFKEGHCALLAVSGQLDGIIGEGEFRHIVKAIAKKNVTTTFECDPESGDSLKIMREHFVIESKVLLPDGTILCLGENKPDDENSEVA
ncbi:MAG: hypothetical protein HQL31_11285 [Planctomycetes bacterium]|nr:hypothetical protein [Planctomycetota bacterium]